MADVRWEIYIRQSDGTDFSVANETGAAVRLRSSTASGGDGGEYTGNVAGSGDFSETGNGNWYIQIDSGDSDWYLVESMTTATGSWASVNGFAPIYIIRDDMLPLTGGTMSGNIVMGDNSVTGLDTLTFTDVDGTIAGIANKNLVDKAAAETVTGVWSHTAFIDITKDKLKIGGTAVTITAAEANMLDGLTTTSKLMTMDTSLADRTTALTNADTPKQLAYTDTGYLSCNTSGGVLQLTLPAANVANIGAKYIIDLVTAGSDLTVVCSGADNFTFMTASDTQTTGTTVTMDTAKNVVSLELLNADYWMINGGTGVVIT